MWLQWSSVHFFWRPQGTFGGAFDLEEGTWARTPWGLPFTFAGMRNYLDHAIELARREWALWILKDLRRAGRREALLAVAREGPPALASFRDRFLAGEDPARLEAEIRGDRQETSGLPVPPPPAQFVDRLAARAAQEKRLAEAKKLLEQADRMWNQPGRASFAIYKRLLKDYPAELERLQVRGRVDRRAAMDEEPQ